MCIALWFVLSSSGVKSRSSGIRLSRETRGGCGFVHTARRRLQGDLGLLSQSGSCSQSAPGPSLPTLHFLAKGLLPPGCGHFPPEAQWAQTITLGKFFWKACRERTMGAATAQL